MTKLEELESRISKLEKLLSQVLIGNSSGWKKLSEAAKELNVCSQTLRRKILVSKTFPERSQFKKGIHWRGEKHYEIHVSKWLNIL